MKILGAIGLGLAIIIIRYLVPEIFSVLVQTLLQFFHILQTMLSMGESSLSAGVFLPQLPVGSEFPQITQTAW
ncbi:MAG: hypothetical protein WC229_01610 [Candidatus Paceibacterota bacterium]|jgi:hypothetical protein